MTLLAVALASGSNGNAIYVETPDVRLLFDAGSSGRRLERRADSRGVSLSRVDALLLSHGHSDHVSAAGVLHRRYGLPVYATRGTWSIASRRVGAVAEANVFLPGEPLVFGRTEVQTVPTPHDAPGSVAFAVESEGQRIGILTDLGHVFDGLLDLFATLDGAFLESNHDPEMLRSGPYPEFLKQRVAGTGGHISNEECVALVEKAASSRLQFVALAHLSEECNTPERALEVAGPLCTVCPTICLAPRDRASPRLALDA